MVLTILVVGEETKLLLPGSKIITGRMHVQHHKFTNFPPGCYQLIGKSVFIRFTKTVICTSHLREST